MNVLIGARYILSVDRACRQPLKRSPSHLNNIRHRSHAAQRDYATRLSDSSTRSSPLQISYTIQERVSLAKTAEMHSSMHMLYHGFALCSLFSQALASVIQPHLFPTLESALLNQTRTNSNSSTSLLQVPGYVCNGDLYRRNLRQESCINALATISRDREVVTFGPRTSAIPFHVELPFRWISGTYEHTINLHEVAAN